MICEPIGVKRVELIEWNHLGEIGIYRQFDPLFLQKEHDRYLESHDYDERSHYMFQYMRKKMIMEFAESLAKRLLGEDDEPEQGEMVRKMARNGILLKLNEADLVPGKDGKIQIRMDVIVGRITETSMVSVSWADGPVKLEIPSLKGGS